MFSVEIATPDGHARSQILQLEQKSKVSSMSSCTKCIRPLAHLVPSSKRRGLERRSQRHAVARMFVAKIVAVKISPDDMNVAQNFLAAHVNRIQVIVS